MEGKKIFNKNDGYSLGQFVAKVYLAVGSGCILSILVAFTIRLLRWILF